jgi:DNA-binding transcriptional LysR family regulator
MGRHHATVLDTVDPAAPLYEGVGIGFASAGLQYPVLTAPDSVLQLIAVEGVRLERHIYLILPSAGETSPAARRFADQLLRIRPAGS